MAEDDTSTGYPARLEMGYSVIRGPGHGEWVVVYTPQEPDRLTDQWYTALAFNLEDAYQIARLFTERGQIPAGYLAARYQIEESRRDRERDD